MCPAVPQAAVIPDVPHEVWNDDPEPETLLELIGIRGVRLVPRVAFAAFPL
jgi:hypothetical protein